MINWAQVCLPKIQGGMGVLDLELMNLSLLAKWRWKFKDPCCHRLWKQAILLNYYSSHPLPACSPFWSAITHNQALCDGFINYSPCRDSEIQFWHDNWLGDRSLAIQYPYLFNICMNPHISLTVVLDSHGRAVQFARTPTGVQKYEWEELLHVIHSFHSDSNIDEISWGLEHQGQFSVKSLYQFVSFRGVLESSSLQIWKLPIPPKIRVFLWLLVKNRILTKNNLIKRGWVGQLSCFFCPVPESVDHFLDHLAYPK